MADDNLPPPPPPPPPGRLPPVAQVTARPAATPPKPDPEPEPVEPDPDPVTVPLSLSEVQIENVAPPPPPPPPGGPAPETRSSAPPPEPAATDEDLAAAGIKPTRGPSTVLPWTLVVLLLLGAGVGGYFGFTLYQASEDALASERIAKGEAETALAAASTRADAAEARITEIEAEAREERTRLEVESDRLRNLLGPELATPDVLAEQLGALSPDGAVRSSAVEVAAVLPTAALFGDDATLREDSTPIVNGILAALETLDQTTVMITVRPAAADLDSRALAHARALTLANQLSAEGAIAAPRLTAASFAAPADGAPSVVMVTVRAVRPTPAPPSEDAPAEGEAPPAEGEAPAPEAAPAE